MNDPILAGIGRFLLRIPRAIWQGQVAADAQRTDLRFMTAEHHRVRDFVVTELPRAGQPLAPEAIAARLDLPPARVTEILDELERRLTFVFRNAEGAVTWAYPVTVDGTPHRVTFGTGERVYAA